jgi:predicted Rdx family selenoprotein
MVTFPSPELSSVTLVPLDAPDTAGRFRLWLLAEDKELLIWDRKTEGGFPELKVVVCAVTYPQMLLYFTSLQKQRIRDLIAPNRNLGHSDRGKAG